MNLVDSSGWLEYFADGENAAFFSAAIEDTQQLLVPTICLYEVYKRVMAQRGEEAALVAIGDMLHGQVAELDVPIALAGAKLSAERKLPMADSLILATAQFYEAVIWTQDADFRGIEGVEYIRKGGTQAE